MNKLPLIALALAAGAGLSACERETPYYAMNEAPARPAASTAPAPAQPAPQASLAEAPRTDALSREALSDAAITARVKATLLADPALSGADVSVNTDSGVVTLTGTVKSQEQAAIASSHAQRYDGVMRIDNHLSPTPQ